MKDNYTNKGWDYAIDTPVEINGTKHSIRMEEGMTGIGSRAYFIDGERQISKAVLQSEDLTKGNHFIYKINWRGNPWDTVDIIINEKFVADLLNKENQPEWRNPILLNI